MPVLPASWTLGAAMCIALAAAAASGCAKPASLAKDAEPAASHPASSSAPAPPFASASSASPEAGPPADAAAPVEKTAPDAGVAAPVGATATPEVPPAVVADNRVDPIKGPDLDARAKALFDAIVKDEPAGAEAFWFPKEPFLPLKDIKDPGKYWSQLHRTYVNDVHALHKKRKSWSRAVFVRFDGWSQPKWVKPGAEANKIGYYRAFHGKLRYTIDGQEEALDVHTIITWQGRWFVTHLRKFKK